MSFGNFFTEKYLNFVVFHFGFAWLGSELPGLKSHLQAYILS